MSKVIQEAVRSKYGSVAASGLSSDQAGVRAVAEAFGYSAEELPRDSRLRPTWASRAGIRRRRPT